MPQVGELQERIRQAHFILTFDLVKGYWQILFTQTTELRQPLGPHAVNMNSVRCHLVSMEARQPSKD